MADFLKKIKDGIYLNLQFMKMEFLPLGILLVVK